MFLGNHSNSCVENLSLKSKINLSHVMQDLLHSCDVIHQQCWSYMLSLLHAETTCLCRIQKHSRRGAWCPRSLLQPKAVVNVLHSSLLPICIRFVITIDCHYGSLAHFACNNETCLLSISSVCHGSISASAWDLLVWTAWFSPAATHTLVFRHKVKANTWQIKSQCCSSTDLNLLPAFQQWKGPSWGRSGFKSEVVLARSRKRLWSRISSLVAVNCFLWVLSDVSQ